MYRHPIIVFVFFGGEDNDDDNHYNEGEYDDCDSDGVDRVQADLIGVGDPMYLCASQDNAGSKGDSDDDDDEGDDDGDDDGDEDDWVQS